MGLGTSQDWQQVLQVFWVPVNDIQAPIALPWDHVPCHSKHYKACHSYNEPLFHVEYDEDEFHAV